MYLCLVFLLKGRENKKSILRHFRNDLSRLWMDHWTSHPLFWSSVEISIVIES